MRRHYAADDNLLTVADVAAKLDLSVDGALKLLRRIDARMTRPGRKLYVRQSELDAALERYTTGDRAVRLAEVKRAG